MPRAKPFDAPPVWVLFSDADVLRLGEETQRFFAAFAADAALLHSAKWDAQIAHKPAIYPDGAGVNFFSNAMSAAEILRPNARGKAVIDIISVTDHFIFAVERRDRYHRAEDFFAIRAT